jgi:hypothetical protein
MRGEDIDTIYLGRGTSSKPDHRSSGRLHTLPQGAAECFPRRFNTIGTECFSLVSVDKKIGYVGAMTWTELTPEAVAVLKALLGGPRPVEDSPLLQLLLADRLVKGSPERIQITQQGSRLLAHYVAAEIG